MNNIFKLIWGYRFQLNFLFLFVISVSLIVKNNHYHNTSFFTSYFELSGSLHKKTSGLKQYLHLKEENERLAKENAILKQDSRSALYKRSNGRITINDTVYDQKYLYLNAQVVNFSLSQPVNYIILDIGSKQGVRPEMGVTTSDGLVGVVKDVSKNFCSVISLLNNKTELPAVLQKSGYSGRVVWEQKDQSTLTLYDIPKNIDVLAGDLVVTGRASSTFPEGVTIGYVEQIEDIPGEPFYKIFLKTAVSFNNLSHVYVIENVLKTEQDAIKKKFLDTFN